MKTLEYLKIFNKEKSLDVDKLIYIKGYYLSMYRYYMLCLYDKGYIDDPTIFDSKIIMRNILELDIKGICDTLGLYSLESKRIKYAIIKNKGNEYAEEFLNILYYVLKYKEYSDSIDSFYETFGDNVVLGLKLDKGKISTKKDAVLNKANLRSFIEMDETIEEINIDKFKVDLILKSMGIDNCEDYIIDKDLSYQDTIDLCDIIFGSHTPNDLDGEYSDYVKDWLKTHNRSILSHCYSHNGMQILGKMSEVLNSLNQEDIVCIYHSSIFIKRKIRYKKYPLGFFGIIGGHNGDKIIEEEIVNGYTGEGYTASYLTSEGYNYIGIPVKVGDSYVFDREQTNVTSDSWFKSTKVDFMFEEPTIKEIKSEEDAIQSSREGTLGVLEITNLKKEGAIS